MHANDFGFGCSTGFMAAFMVYWFFFVFRRSRLVDALQAIRAGNWARRLGKKGAPLGPWIAWHPVEKRPILVARNKSDVPPVEMFYDPDARWEVRSPQDVIVDDPGDAP